MHGVLELAPNIGLNVIAEVIEPKLLISLRVFSLPGACIWVNSSTCEESLRRGRVSAAHRLEFVIVHFCGASFSS